LAIGGGLRASRVGELVMGRAGVILKSDKVALDLVPIRNDPNAAGLIGAARRRSNATRASLAGLVL
jgi:hypothetical protein